ncbi:response regulator [Mucilaginibacter flavidus]|uniref:response regulator n=1 Tax=Mucilaginibacter flavidus TaxID=2949309 RepID=UPI0020927AA5|nr:response regulator [Mucilaginibacter flavidus]MCO5948856.1 response regulator [Mucilaginibacter flavidus]
MDKEFSFIIIDDSELDCFVIQKVIERAFKNLDIISFQNANNALEAIKEQGVKTKPTIILLDIQMPLMNGFQFIEEFEKFSPQIQDCYTVIILSILSATRAPADIHTEFNKRIVGSIIEKPFTIEKLLSLLKNMGLADEKIVLSGKKLLP